MSMGIALSESFAALAAAGLRPALFMIPSAAEYLGITPGAVRWLIKKKKLAVCRLDRRVQLPLAGPRGLDAYLAQRSAV